MCRGTKHRCKVLSVQFYCLDRYLSCRQMFVELENLFENSKHLVATRIVTANELSNCSFYSAVHHVQINLNACSLLLCCAFSILAEYECRSSSGTAFKFVNVFFVNYFIVQVWQRGQEWNHFRSLLLHISHLVDLNAQCIFCSKIKDA